MMVGEFFLPPHPPHGIISFNPCPGRSQKSCAPRNFALLRFVRPIEPPLQQLAPWAISTIKLFDQGDPSDPIVTKKDPQHLHLWRHFHEESYQLLASRLQRTSSIDWQRYRSRKFKLDIYFYLDCDPVIVNEERRLGSESYLIFLWRHQQPEHHQSSNTLHQLHSFGPFPPVYFPVFSTGCLSTARHRVAIIAPLTSTGYSPFTLPNLGS
ncbi:hypothetical protein Pst134EA_026840 [Puccinia striiformis f. sp. tritici]|uniref:hypothetical protein n=1 Tax=Puccinia striiformis f. sp. tritici TaxID=168172 RepID=UPI00200757F2|nr:hypothetical protein Pst134EA_026840 [Puccinia striiformis f. sp. tritici]KAH9450130.1 hypothetical protein Pst134EA_026840 [Puccinia striiformis f. sp. tritici]